MARGARSVSSLWPSSVAVASDGDKTLDNARPNRVGLIREILAGRDMSWRPIEVPRKASGGSSPRRFRDKPGMFLCRIIAARRFPQRAQFHQPLLQPRNLGVDFGRVGRGGGTVLTSAEHVEYRHQHRHRRVANRGHRDPADEPVGRTVVNQDRPGDQNSHGENGEHRQDQCPFESLCQPCYEQQRNVSAGDSEDRRDRGNPDKRLPAPRRLRPDQHNHQQRGNQRQRQSGAGDDPWPPLALQGCSARQPADAGERHSNGGQQHAKIVIGTGQNLPNADERTARNRHDVDIKE